MATACLTDRSTTYLDRAVNGAQHPPVDAKQKILEAADRLLAAQGIDGTSTAQVAEEAGVNKALVFYYYGNKAKLVDAVLERYYADHLAALSAAFESGESPRERLHRLVDAYLDFMHANQRFARLAQQLSSSGHGAVIERNMGALLEWTKGALDGLTPPSGPLAARQFFVTFSGVVIGYFTYAPMLGAAWGKDPLAAKALTERRKHVHWLVDAIFDKLAA